MTKNRVSTLLCGLVLLAGCTEEPPARTVYDFLDSPILLEAAIVRCAQNRAESRYEAECVSARQAISIIEAREERAKAEAFEAQSERKRKALRRTQEAVAEARRRAAEAERVREEAEYLAQFGEPPPAADDTAVTDATAANAPDMVIPDAEEEPHETRTVIESTPATDGGNAPVVENEPASDPDAVREELDH
jgi:hypothetical protein